MSPADRVIRHFPSEENDSPEGGRLAEEARRLGAIFAEASDRSLVLLNESLSSISPSESLCLAEDVIRGLRLLGAHVLFATHLHEFGERIGAINEDTHGDSRLVSLVAGIMTAAGRGDGENGEARRTYRIRPGLPVGLSYARDIADRYEISFERLRPKILSRRRHAAGSQTE